MMQYGQYSLCISQRSYLLSLSTTTDTHTIIHPGAEFCNMTNGGKVALYLQSILEEIGMDQILPTEILAVTCGACQLTNARQPTRHT